MAETGDLALTLVLVVVIEGIWLAGLTYLMWRRYLAQRKAKAQEQKSEEPDQTRTA